MKIQRQKAKEEKENNKDKVGTGLIAAGTGTIVGNTLSKNKDLG